jgi:hypothetical protein
MIAKVVANDNPVDRRRPRAAAEAGWFVAVEAPDGVTGDTVGEMSVMGIL